jgi:hypothetical protein
MINTNWKIAKYAWLFALMFCLGIFVPSIIGMDGMNGGYALATFSLFLCLTSVVSALVFGSLAKQQDKLLQGKDLLAHWTYTKEEWGLFYQGESVRDQKEKTMLFYIVAAWAILFGILFPIYDPEDGIFVTYVMVGLIALIGAVAILSIKITRHNLKEHGGEAFISTKGAYISGQMHSWSLAAGSLLDVSYLDASPQRMIQIDYLGGKTEYSVHIPVPHGKEDQAQKVVETLRSQT